MQREVVAPVHASLISQAFFTSFTPLLEVAAGSSEDSQAMTSAATTVHVLTVMRSMIVICLEALERRISSRTSAAWTGGDGERRLQYSAQR
jgi:hypothetical protein